MQTLFTLKQKLNMQLYVGQKWVRGLRPQNTEYTDRAQLAAEIYSKSRLAGWSLVRPVHRSSPCLIFIPSLASRNNRSFARNPLKPVIKLRVWRIGCSRSLIYAFQLSVDFLINNICTDDFSFGAKRINSESKQQFQFHRAIGNEHKPNV